MVPTEVIWLFLMKIYVAFAHDFVATHLPPTLPPIGVLVVLAIPVKNYLKRWAIQLAIECTADTVNYLE